MRTPNIVILERFKCMPDGSHKHAGFVIEFGKQHLIGLSYDELFDLREYITSVIQEDVNKEEGDYERS